MESLFVQIEKDLKRRLDAHRYKHTIGVMYTAGALAMKYEADINKAMLAGLLHDCAKCIPSDRKIKLCKKYNIRMTEVEQRNPFLLHAKLGAFIAAKKYNIEDDEIISAILNHTTGKPDMGQLDKIIFLADYIEPQRNKATRLSEIRKTAFEDLDKAVALVMHDTLQYIQNFGGEIDPITKIAYDFYKEYL